MKRIISFALIFIMALSLAACRQPKEASVDPTDAPKPTETVTQPTAEPTEAPAKTAADFSSCGTVIARLVPGEGENDVHYRFTGYSEDVSCYLPYRFFVGEGKIYIHDEPSSVLVYDTETGECTRLAVLPEDMDWPPFAVLGDLVVFLGRMYDMSSGETVRLSGGFTEKLSSFMYVSDGKVFSVSSGSAGKGYYRKELDIEGRSWSDPETIVDISGRDEDGSPIFAFAEGVPFVPFRHWDGLYLGDGPDGSHYFLDRSGAALADGETGVSISKYDASGTLAAYTILPYDRLDLFPDNPNEDIVLGGDGCVYLMADFPNEVVIYRIEL